MKIKLQLPIKVNVDNKGVIFIYQNPNVKRTKKIYTRYNFIRKYIKCIIISIKLVQTDKNKSDIMKKNFSKDKHHSKFDDIVKQVNQERG